MDHIATIRHLLAHEFPDDAPLRSKLEASFDNASWEESELGEAKQLAISILMQRFGMPSRLRDSVTLSTRVDTAFELGPSQMFANRIVPRPHRES